MLDLEIFIFEFVAINRLSASSIPEFSFINLPVGKITSLNHEILDNAMEFGVFVAKSILAGRQFLEISGCFGDDIAKETNNYAALRHTTNGYVKKHFIGHSNLCLGEYASQCQKKDPEIHLLQGVFS